MAATDGAWLRHVPEAARAQVNPYAGDPDAALAGAAIFKRSCASCHGDDATGRGDHPSLRTKRVHDATDGELAWLLKNGNMKNGMPSWSRLPEAQRWQLVRYLRTLPLDPAPNVADSAKRAAPPKLR
jgi:mono/diheme cytochrome c family protein